MSLLLLLKQGFFAAIPACGFALLFNVPRAYLAHCALLGGSAYMLRSLIMQLGLPVEWSSLIVSTLIGLVTVYWSRRYLIPRPVFNVAAIIPMIPGKFAFAAMLGIISMHQQGIDVVALQQVISDFLTTLFILAALSFGLAVPSILIYRNRPIV